MNIVITGSLGNIGKPLTQELVQKGHTVTVISRKEERKKEIEAIGAKAAIGAMQDADFLAATFKGADIVYLMESWEGMASIFDKDADFIGAFNSIGNNYKQAVEQSGGKTHCTSKQYWRPHQQRDRQSFSSQYRGKYPETITW
ncbi:NAD(P)H-binding protein [Chitinophaga sp. OAE865]|uniref:SDR family oxidoreductase n=1 Tax=Chitinophaga sp. OAE865 TaxID=2817898 RepID=UPI003398557E